MIFPRISQDCGFRSSRILGNLGPEAQILGNLGPETRNPGKSGSGGLDPWKSGSGDLEFWKILLRTLGNVVRKSWEI